MYGQVSNGVVMLYLGGSRHLVSAPCEVDADAVLLVLGHIGKAELCVGRDDCYLPQIPACSTTTSLPHPEVSLKHCDLQTCMLLLISEDDI